MLLGGEPARQGDEGHEEIEIALLLQTGDVRHDWACLRKTAADKKRLECRRVIPGDAGLERHAAGGEVEHSIQRHARYAVIHAADAAHHIERQVRQTVVHGVVAVAADDVRTRLEGHGVQSWKRERRVVDGKAVVPRHRVAERDAGERQLLFKGDFLRGEAVGVEAERREIRPGIPGFAAHDGEDVALVVAVQAGYALRTEQAQGVARRGAEVDLIAQRHDAVGPVLSANIGDDGLCGRQIGVNIGHERDGFHSVLLIKKWNNRIFYDIILDEKEKILPNVSRETF